MNESDATEARKQNVNGASLRLVYVDSERRDAKMTGRYVDDER